MRVLRRNKRKLWYALQIGETPNIDEHGNETGESTPTYGEITALDSNVSAAVGEDAMQAFGNIAEYSRVFCVADRMCPIDENSIIWFGVEPTEPYNYIVRRKADSKNGVLYAIQEVKVR